MTRLSALTLTAAAAALAASAFPAAAQHRQPSVNVGGPSGTGTYAAGPARYYGDPADHRNVPVGRPHSSQTENGCYGGREQVRSGGRLVWVPNVTCPYNPY